MHVPTAFFKFDWINLSDKGATDKTRITQLDLISRTFPESKFQDLEDRGSRRLQWAGHVVQAPDERGIYKALYGRAMGRPS